MPKLDKLISDKLVRTLPVPERGNVLHRDPDLKGFCIRVTANGDCAYVLCYRLGGVERRDTIGNAAVWSASAARELAKEWLRNVKIGVDPRGKPAPEAETEGATFAELVGQFLDEGRSKRGRILRPATIEQYRHALTVHAAELNPRPVADIRRKDVARIIRQVASERGDTAAMHARAALSRFWSWLVAGGEVEGNIVVGSQAYEVVARSRVLDDDEIRRLWAATVEPGPFNVIVRLITWTGARRAEIGGMRATELVDGVWTVPGSRTKNHRPLSLPLPRQARLALQAVETGPAGYLFGGRSAFSNWSTSKAKLDRRLQIEPWSPHDLRRTTQTRLAGLGVPPVVANAILNHARDRVTETYDHHDYLAEKRDALQLWADELDRITGPGAEVVPFARRT